MRKNVPIQFPTGRQVQITDVYPLELQDELNPSGRQRFEIMLHDVVLDMPIVKQIFPMKDEGEEVDKTFTAVTMLRDPVEYLMYQLINKGKYYDCVVSAAVFCPDVPKPITAEHELSIEDWKCILEYFLRDGWARKSCRGVIF